MELVTIVVPEYDPAITFFVEVLGFELVEDSPAQTNDGRPKRWVVVRPYGAETGLLLARADGALQAEVVGKQVAGRVGWFLRVDDFAASYLRLREAGVDFVTEPRTEPYGQVAVFLDVAGNRWDLLGPRPAVAPFRAQQRERPVGWAWRLLMVAQSAGRLLQAQQRAGFQVRFKAPGDVVTSADMAAQKYMRGELEREFPLFPLVFEEQEHPGELPSRCIVVDELDGSAVYTQGGADWGVTLAVIDGGEPVAGVVVQPARGLELVTAKHAGTWLNGTRLGVGQAGVQEAALQNAVVACELNRHTSAEQWAWVQRLAGHCLTLRALGTAVAGALEVLQGHAAVYLNPQGGKVWDFAAAALAVEEAGGVARRVDGGALDWRSIPQGVWLARSEALLEQALWCATNSSE